MASKAVSEFHDLACATTTISLCYQPLRWGRQSTQGQHSDTDVSSAGDPEAPRMPRTPLASASDGGEESCLSRTLQ